MFYELVRRVVIFVVGPSDVEAEKACVRDVVGVLNQEGGFAEQKGIYFQIVDGIQDPVPDAGLPEDVILGQFPPEKWDVVVAIFWARFGSPTGNVNPETGLPYESGSEEEVDRAFRQREKTGRPRILLYLCDRQLPPSGIDPGQFGRLGDYLKQCGPLGTHPLYYKRFRTRLNFQHHLYHDLIELAQSFSGSEAPVVHRSWGSALATEALEPPHVDPEQLMKEMRLGIEEISKTSDSEALRGILDEVYGIMDRLAALLEKGRGQIIDAEAINDLLSMDEEIVTALCVRLRQDQDLKNYLAERRAWTRADLKAGIAGSRNEVAPFSKVVGRLLDSTNELGSWDAFAELAIHHLDELTSRVAASKAGPQLLQSLWERADNILLSDGQAGIHPAWENPVSLFRALSESPEDPGRFRTVRFFLESDGLPGRLRMIHKLRENGFSGEILRRDTDLLSRCLLVAHKSPAVRRDLVYAADIKQLSLLLIHPYVPFSLIRDSLTRADCEEGHDVQRLLFDCVRSRISRALRRERAADLEPLGALLERLFSLEGLSVRGYCDRLVRLYELFQQTASRLGQKGGGLREVYRASWTARKSDEKIATPGSAPYAISEFPLPVKRHLAREGRYLSFLTSQPEAVALELVPFLWPEQLPSLLNGSFNGRLLNKLFTRKSFADRPLLLTALHHPKCDIAFARQRLPSLMERELRRLKDDRHANTAVREMAAQQLQRLQSVRRRA